MRERLAAVLINNGIYWGGDEPGIADALLPTVRSIIADELRAAADDLATDDDAYVRRHGLRPVRNWLRARADALELE